MNKPAINSWIRSLIACKTCVDDTALNTVTELTVGGVDLWHGILSAAVLLIVVVCGSVICALTVKVHRLRKHSESDQCGQPNAILNV